MYFGHFIRVKAYIVFGENAQSSTSSACQSPVHMHGLSTQIDFPENGWEDIVKAFPSNTHFQFNLSHIVTYFITRSVTDGKAAGDLKSINKSAENLFTCGHIQSIQVYLSESYLYLKAKCLPEMRKDRVYLLKMALKSEGNDIVFAECRCPAGKGPRGSCKHIAALSYAHIFSHRKT